MKLAERVVGSLRVSNLIMGGAAGVALCAGALTFHWLFI